MGFVGIAIIIAGQHIPMDGSLAICFEGSWLVLDKISLVEWVIPDTFWGDEQFDEGNNYFF